MRCNCCDKVLTPQEISYNKEIDAFELCNTCLNVALEAAFSDGFRASEDVQMDPDVDNDLDTLDGEETLSLFNLRYEIDFPVSTTANFPEEE